MDAARRISLVDYVARVPPEMTLAHVTQRLVSLGRAEPVAGYPDLFLVHLTSPPDEAKQGWETLREALGQHVEIGPVYLDEEGKAQYAVGTLIVRFATPLSDAELAAWSEPQGLRVKARNKYVPSQVALQPIDPGGRFLPEILADVQSQGDKLVAVWPETLAPFRRS